MHRTFVTSLILITISATVHAEDWPQFRGPNSSGVSSSKNLPVEFSHQDKVRWSAAIGDGQSSPVVVAEDLHHRNVAGEEAGRPMS